VDEEMAEAGIAPDPEGLRGAFMEKVEAVMAEATLTIPENRFAQSGGKTGFRHSEHLGHLLTQMQWLQRAYPGATW
jgi:ring-1,2-phenylacetyl-CoA epoxidase subunit PaaC